MCGIAGIISNQPIEQSHVLAMRDELEHRGPDDLGVTQTSCGTIGHTRLSILDLSALGHQPMQTPDKRFSLVYNGELYNNNELRKELNQCGVQFQSTCDTETVLHALATWGMEARNKFRGMYSFAFIDTLNQVCLLARDPMGVKPLYTAKMETQNALLFASEIRSIVAHPGFSPQPDWVAMSAYMTTIRPEFARRTLYQGIQPHEPGEWSLVSTETLEVVQSASVWETNVHNLHSGNPDETEHVIRDSVVAHLRSDVPMCALLSGGLDSSIIAKIAMDELGSLRTFCAGARSEGFDDDFAMAKLVSQHLGTEHTEVEITRELFLKQWQSMLARTRLPLSTPNEVAIHEVCKELRNQGFPVTLSGEGADELFGGYEIPMMKSHAFVDSIDDSDRVAGAYHIESNAWVSAMQKPMVLNEQWSAISSNDEELRSWYQNSYDALRASTSDSEQAHLAFLRRMNLTNLLRRLDTSSMLCSVEGRTPFADINVARFAESLPMQSKFVPGEQLQTKIALRNAFATGLPDQVVNRSKASFPLPFQEWIGSVSQLMTRSTFAKELYRTSAIELITKDPHSHWNLTWPMLNLVIWGEQQWGDQQLVAEVFDHAASAMV